MGDLGAVTAKRRSKGERSVVLISQDSQWTVQSFMILVNRKGMDGNTIMRLLNCQRKVIKHVASMCLDKLYLLPLWLKLLEFLIFQLTNTFSLIEAISSILDPHNKTYTFRVPECNVQIKERGQK